MPKSSSCPQSSLSLSLSGTQAYVLLSLSGSRLAAVQRNQLSFTHIHTYTPTYTQLLSGRCLVALLGGQWQQRLRRCWRSTVSCLPLTRFSCVSHSLASVCVCVCVCVCDSFYLCVCVCVCECWKPVAARQAAVLRIRRIDCAANFVNCRGSILCACVCVCAAMGNSEMPFSLAAAAFVVAVWPLCAQQTTNNM